MAVTATLSLAFSLEPNNNKPIQTPSFCLSPRHHHHHHFLSLKPHNRSTFKFKPSFSSSRSPPSPSSGAETYSLLEPSFRTGNFLTNDELDKLKLLQGFLYYRQLKSGSLSVRVMRSDEMDRTVRLLAESFAESMLLPVGYEAVLRFLVKQYLVERRGALPHAVTLIGFYRTRDGGDGGGVEEEEELAGTVEVCFDKIGANASPPTPMPPKDSPYICNMTVKKPLRRKGIGWHLLKASEELISQMSFSKEVYLHCRIIDTAPFSMYTKAGYKIVRTDSFLILLMLQRRKHLMCKKLPPVSSPSEADVPASDDKLTSSVNM